MNARSMWNTILVLGMTFAAIGQLYATGTAAPTAARDAEASPSAAADSQAGSDLPKRPVNGEEAAIKVPALEPITTATANPPALFYISKLQRGSSFDLKGGTLNFVASNLVQVYPLVYRGKAGNVHVFWEASPYGWTWLFEDKAGFTGAVYYQEKPSEPIRVFDAKAAKAVRTP